MAKKTEYTINTYVNGSLDVTIGKTYGGEGYSGLTDGEDVRGKLTEVDYQWDSVTIWSDKLNCPCAVKMRSIYVIEDSK